MGGGGKGKGTGAAIKGQQAIEQQFANIAQNQANIGSQYANIGLPALQSGSNYWQQLLQGGPAAQQAVGPMAQQITQSSQGALQNLKSNLPAGGESNLAQANLLNQRAQQIGQLYQGVQPQAAQALSQLGVGAGQTGAGVTGAGSFLGYAGVGAGQGALSALLNQQQQQQSLGTGVGQALGSILAGKG